MSSALKRCISLLLALLLLFSVAPLAFAADEAETPVTTEDTQLESTEAPEVTEEPADSSFSESESESETTSDEGIMLAASTTSNLMFFNLANPDYTVRMNTQVTITYAENGNGTVRTGYVKNLGWHYAGSNKNHTLYCIEPYKNFGESTSYNAVDNDVTLDGSGSTHGADVWYSLPANRREAIGLILLYSDSRWDDSVDVTTTSKDNNPNVPLRVATQFLIYEIVTGLRDLHTEIVSWLCLLGALPFALLGFVKYNGMTAEKLFVAWFCTKILEPKELCFKPMNLYYEVMKDDIAKREKELKKNHETD